LYWKFKSVNTLSAKKMKKKTWIEPKMEEATVESGYMAGSYEGGFYDGPS